MAKQASETIEELLKKQNELIKDQMILSLGLAGVPQADIRKLVGVDIYRVNGIVKYLKKAKQNG